MIRLLHLLAITLLLGSAGYAYSIKYDALYQSENLAKLRRKLQKEHEAIAVSKAEWALLTRPDRLQRMVERHLDMQPMGIAQLGTLAELPNRPSRSDAIGAKLDTLGVDPPVTGSLKGKGAPGASGAPAPSSAPARRDPLGAKLDALGLGAGAPRSGPGR